jgi:hypothetical protein
MEHELQSTTIGEIAKALCAAQATISSAIKDSKNPFFNSNYADLGSVTAAIRESFHANGLAYAQTTLASEKGPTIVTTLMHSSGEWIRGFLFIPAVKCDPQQFGSAMTYGRRYALAAIAGVIQEDDDGNAATSAAGNAPAKPAPKTAPKSTGKNFNLEKVLKQLGESQTLEALDAVIANWKPTIDGWNEDDKKAARVTYATVKAAVIDPHRNEPGM